MVFLKKTNYNTKITQIEGKIPDISNLATKTALTTVAQANLANFLTKKSLQIKQNTYNK